MPHRREDEEKCAQVIVASGAHDLDPLAGVALLSLYALAEMNFEALRAWVRVAKKLSQAVSEGCSPEP